MPSRAPILIAFFLVACALVGWWPVLDQPFMGYDDDVYVTDNPAVTGGLSPAGLGSALLDFHGANWHPVTWISHQADVTLFGLDPRGHHLTSLLLHALNSVLLFAWLNGATGSRRRSAFVAALFALHPVAADSVAWVAERKNLLATGFGFAALLAWTGYVRRPSAGRYAWVALWFGLGLMSKPMLVMLPLLLLLVDFWPLARFGSRGVRPLLLEKLPLLALSLGAAALTVLAQDSGGAVEGLDPFPLSMRLANAVVALPTYTFLVVWPAWPNQLAILHPHLGEAIGFWRVAVGLAAAAALVVAVLALGRRRPYLWMGAGWTWIALVPVIGLVQVGAQSHAERYVYLPMVGLLIAATWWVADQARAYRVPRAVVGPVAVLVLLMLGLASRQELAHWRSEAALFSRAVEVYENTGVATRHAMILYYQLGHALQEAGKIEEAVEAYRNALTLNADDPRPHNNLGSSLARLGRQEEAAAAYQKALQVEPGHPSALYNLASFEQERGNVARARELYVRFLSRTVHSSAARNHAIRSLLEIDAPTAAALLRAGPRDAQSLALLSQAEQQLGQDVRALEALEQALALDPTARPLRNNLAFLLATSRDAAVRQPDRALAIMDALAVEAPLDPEESDTLRAVQAAREAQP